MLGKMRLLNAGHIQFEICMYNSAALLTDGDDGQITEKRLKKAT